MRAGGWALLTLYFLGCGVLLATRYLILPSVGEYRAEIAAQLSRATGLQVEIARLNADWDGLRPRLRIDGFVLREPSGEAALKLGHIDASLGWSSVLRGRLYLNRLVIERPDLDIRRAADGRLFVAGIPIRAEAAEGGNDLADWAWAQRSIVIHDARVSWTDLQRGAPVLSLEHVSFRLENDGRTHRFGLLASPPAAYASQLDLRGEFVGRLDTPPEKWRGAVYGNLDQVDLSIWQQWVDYPLSLQRGQGGLRIWLERDRFGRAQATLDVALRDVSLRVDKQLPVLDLPNLSGRFSADRKDGRVQVSGHQLSLTTAAGVAMPPTNFHFERRESPGKAPAGEFEADRLDVAPLAGLAVHLPFPAAWRNWLVAFKPRGRFSELRLGWTGEEGLPSAYHVNARFNDLGLTAQGISPGLYGWSGEVSANEQGGRFDLAVNQGGLDFPAVFEEGNLPLADGHFTGTWARTADGTEFRLKSARFRNADAEGEASGSYLWTGKGSGRIDLKAHLSRADGARVWRYMPKLIHVDVRDWLKNSIETGRAEDVDLRLRGPLDDFPFRRRGEGEFRITGRLLNARLAYAPKWPKIDAIQGTLLFEGAAMTIQAERGKVFGTILRKVRARIEDLDQGNLVVDGEATGPTAEFLRFVNTSPVADAVGDLTRQTQAQGNGQLTLNLRIPLEHADDTQAAGEYRFEHNRIQLLPELPELADSSGRLQFTERSLRIPEANAVFLGAPVRVTGATRADGTVDIQAKGTFAVRNLAARLESPLFDHISGAAGVTANIAIHSHTVKLSLDSDLVGLASSLPAPFNKSTASANPLHLDWQWRSEDGRLSEQVRGEIAAFGRAAFDFETSQDQRALLRGVIALGKSEAKLPRQGIALVADLPALDLDAWLRVGESGGDGAPAPAVDSINLKTGVLTVRGVSLVQQNIQATRSGTRWDGKLSGPALLGDFSWDGSGGGRLRARLTRAAITPPAGGKQALAEEDAPQSEARRIPAIDLVAGNFAYAGRELGSVTLKGEPEGNNWKLQHFAIESPDGQLEAQGEHEAGAQGGATRLRFSLNAPDAGNMLARLGYPGMLRRGSVELSGALDWKGAPRQFSYGLLNGELELKMSKGQFSKIEPGVGRLLGILSLQSLPRRLTLDFGDVFSEGFAFDSISGSMKISHGVIQTDDLRIVGPAAKVFMHGSADLAAETQNLTVKVQPTLSETVAIGAALGPAAAIGSINPLIGLAAYVAQKVMRDPVEKLFSYEYSVTGHWADPKVVRVSPAPAAQIGKTEGRTE